MSTVADVASTVGNIIVTLEGRGRIITSGRYIFCYLGTVMVINTFHGTHETPTVLK